MLELKAGGESRELHGYGKRSGIKRFGLPPDITGSAAWLSLVILLPSSFLSILF